jgi:hypothetical protein
MFLFNSRRWFVLCMVYMSYLALVHVSSFIDWAQLSRFSSEEGDRIQSPKRCVLNKNMTMYNVQKHNICINVPSSQTFISYPACS